MYEYRTLENESISSIIKCANEAFSDYEIPLQLDEKDIVYRWKEANVRYDLSCGAYLDNKLVGIIINAADMLDDKFIAFDMMTGVIPSQQGNNLLNEMLDFSKIQFKKYEVDTYYLEVLQTNEKAVHIYTKLGFEKSKDFACFAGEITNEVDNQMVIFTPLSDMHIIDVVRYPLSSSSFENSYEKISRNISDHDIVYMSEGSLINSFIIINKETLKVKQLYCETKEQLASLLSVLKKEYGSIKINNIDADNTELVENIKDLGLDNFTNQYQMKMELKKD